METWDKQWELASLLQLQRGLSSGPCLREGRPEPSLEPQAGVLVVQTSQAEPGLDTTQT